jgi:hypothetical protein
VPADKQAAEPEVPRMQSWLTRQRDGSEPHKSWAQARADFTGAEARVDALIRDRCLAQQRLDGLPGLAERERELRVGIEESQRRIRRIENELSSRTSARERAEADLTTTLNRHDRQLAVKPGVLETIFTLGRAVRDWRSTLAPLSDSLRWAEQRMQEAADASRRTADELQKLRGGLSSSEAELAGVRDSQTRTQAECARDREKYGDAYPGEAWSGDRRELRAPWLDAELDTARSDLFLAALDLHRDFLSNAANDMLDGLRAACDVIAGNHPRSLEPEKLRAAWQLFFLCVPLVSTTFAALGRMFGEIGPEAIGWLLVDEAGQAAPQYAVGGIWRARRVIAVGDPLQLEPVVAIPQKAQHDIALSFGVSNTWLPPRASVQTLADRVATFGTTLDQAEERVWVSAPLRVHRRCDDPMFSLCNQIAYNGIMVNGVHRKSSDPFNEDATPLIAASHWVDEPAGTPGRHLQPNQIDRLERALAYLRGVGVTESNVIAISPFRDVADQLSELAAKYPGLRAGTIHTAQGREADVVILVLGGDPTRPGAKAWAASTVNLVNVAASRAKRRLYVIGDRKAWKRHNYFRELVAYLD